MVSIPAAETPLCGCTRANPRTRLKKCRLREPPAEHWIDAEQKYAGL
jgi:hypothetical protein